MGKNNQNQLAEQFNQAMNYGNGGAIAATSQNHYQQPGQIIHQPNQAIPVQYPQTQQPTIIQTPPPPPQQVQPLQVIYSQQAGPPIVPKPSIYVQRQIKFWNAWKLHPDNEWRLLHISGAILYSLFNKPVGSAKSIVVLIGVSLIGISTITGIASFLWKGQATYTGPGVSNNQAVPDANQYLPTIDIEP